MADPQIVEEFTNNTHSWNHFWADRYNEIAQELGSPLVNNPDHVIYGEFTLDYAVLERLERVLDLSRINISELGMREEILSRRILAGVNLSHANLAGASLPFSNMQGANLFSACLAGTNLNGTDLRRANLEVAELQRADLANADLEGANLFATDLRWSDLRGANLRGVDFVEGPMITGAKLVGAILRDANIGDELTWGELTRADIRGASLSYAHGLTLRDVDAQGADLREVIGICRIDAPDGTRVVDLTRLEGAYFTVDDPLHNEEVREVLAEALEQGLINRGIVDLRNILNEEIAVGDRQITLQQYLSKYPMESGFYDDKFSRKLEKGNPLYPERRRKYVYEMERGTLEFNFQRNLRRGIAAEESLFNLLFDGGLDENGALTSFEEMETTIRQCLSTIIDITELLSKKSSKFNAIASRLEEILDQALGIIRAQHPEREQQEPPAPPPDAGVEKGDASKNTAAEKEKDEELKFTARTREKGPRGPKELVGVGKRGAPEPWIRS